VVILIPKAQRLVAAMLAPVASRAGEVKVGKPNQGLPGQFVLGAVLGAVWSPCAGPSLAAAIGLAAKEGERFGAFLMMLSFGLGAATPLLVVSGLLRKGLTRYRGTLGKIAHTFKPVMGLLLVAVGAAVASGADTVIEAGLLSLLPRSFIDLVARY
jgi:cytochrome c biogenesis protein CcdA